MKKVTIVGYGYVGKSVARFLENTFSLAIYDPPLGYSDASVFNDSIATFICVPVPGIKNGKMDLTAIQSALEMTKSDLIVIKSTIPPGSTDILSAKYKLSQQLVFSPEYIGEATYPIPVQKGFPHPTEELLQPFFIFGGTKVATAKATKLYQSICGPHSEYVQTTAKEAELTKFMENAWIATKVAFCNEFFDIAARLEIDYSILRELWLLDSRVNRSHTLVYPERRGFAGKCVPKDTIAIFEYAKGLGLSPSVLEGVLKSNRKFAAVQEMAKS